MIWRLHSSSTYSNNGSTCGRRWEEEKGWCGGDESGWLVGLVVGKRGWSHFVYFLRGQSIWRLIAFITDSGIFFIVLSMSLQCVIVIPRFCRSLYLSLFDDIVLWDLCNWLRLFSYFSWRAFLDNNNTHDPFRSLDGIFLIQQIYLKFFCPSFSGFVTSLG